MRRRRFPRPSRATARSAAPPSSRSRSLPNVAAALQSRKQIKILAIGASPLLGRRVLGGHGDPVSQLLRRAIKGLDVVMINRGISGELSTQAAQRIKNEVALTEPDLVLWQVGTNDALAYVPLDEFETTLVDTLTWLKEHKIDVVLVGLQYVDQMAVDDHYRAVRDVLRKIAAKENVMIVRRYEAQQFLARAESGGGGLFPDEFQRTEAGYVCLSQYMARAITLGIFGKKVPSMPPAAKTGSSTGSDRSAAAAKRPAAQLTRPEPPPNEVAVPEPMMSVIETAASLRELAEQSNAWPFEEARKIVARLKKKPKDEVIFETGYGPSGLPHIGTFGEVARTTMVRHAFRVLTDDKVKTRLIAFSDDMDGLRKVPDNVPNKEMLAQHLGKPLTKVPDPFGTHPSFGEHNNARLRAFLDTFGFDYEFHVVDAVLQVRPLRRDAAQGARALRRGDEHHAAVAARGAGADLFAVPADRPAHRHRAAGAGDGA